MRIGNAPCSWGVMSGFDPATFPPYDQVLREIAETGYAGTELGDWGFLPTDPAILREALSEHQLAMIGALVPAPLADRESHRKAREDALRTARLLAASSGTEGGGPFIILTDANGADARRTQNAGRIGPEHGLTGEQWDNFALGASGIAAAVSDETGLRTVFHHHCAGFVETPEETARLMEMTPPELLGLCFDTGHWAYAGGDPVEAVRTYGDRIWQVHFKDCHSSVAQAARANQWDYFEALANEIYYGLGTGDIDFPAVLGALTESGYQGWIVVEDELPPGAGDPRASAARDREFMRSLGL
jgi:inosose dehydratase